MEDDICCPVEVVQLFFKQASLEWAVQPHGQICVVDSKDM